MRLHFILEIAVQAKVAIAQPVLELAENTIPLHGGIPLNFANLPPLPPTGFYAWCETPQGFCKVLGNAPIAPGAECYCREYSGRTL